MFMLSISLLGMLLDPADHLGNVHFLLCSQFSCLITDIIT